MNLVAVSAGMADKMSAAMAILAAVIGGFVMMHRWPKVAAVVWLSTLAFIPMWMGVSIGAYFPPASLMALLVLAALLPFSIPGLGTGDMLALAFFSACLLPLTLGDLRMSAVFTLIVIWISAFSVGRVLPGKVDLEWIYCAIAVVMGAVALGSVAEFLTHTNWYISLLHANNSSFDIWSRLQSRGGVVRAEGAFGHSIALGASLALAIPFAIGSRLRTSVRAMLVLTMVAGITVTFSRAAMLSGALALVLSIFFLRNGLSVRVRVGILVTGAMTAAALMPFVLKVFTDASTEATNSSAYREQLISLLQDVAITGTSDSMAVTAGGDSLFGQFDSVDSAVLLLGLTFGMIAMILGLLLYFGGAVSMLRRRGGPPVVAIVAQAPALLSVALITQYASMVWFVAGLAVYAVYASKSQVVAIQAGADQDSSLDQGSSGVADVTGLYPAGRAMVNAGGVANGRQ